MKRGTVKVNDKDVMTVEWNGERVITTAQLSDVYETSTDNIKRNFNRNKKRFEKGKHFYLLEGEDLQVFKDRGTISHLVGKNAKQIYLWTKRGASRHCKILDTEKAWEQFDCLEEKYFNPAHKIEQMVTYQYPITPSALESATNAGRLFERIMKNQGASPYEIAIVVRSLFQQVGVDIPDYAVRVPPYEQLSLEIVTC